MVRGGVKAVALFWLFPLTLIATCGPVFFNRRRQLGHDLFARTTVIDETFVDLKRRK